MCDNAGPKWCKPFYTIRFVVSRCWILSSHIGILFGHFGYILQHIYTNVGSEHTQSGIISGPFLISGPTCLARLCGQPENIRHPTPILLQQNNNSLPWRYILVMALKKIHCYVDTSYARLFGDTECNRYHLSRYACTFRHIHSTSCFTCRFIQVANTNKFVSNCICNSQSIATGVNCHILSLGARIFMHEYREIQSEVRNVYIAQCLRCMCIIKVSPCDQRADFQRPRTVSYAEGDTQSNIGAST